MGKKFLKDKKIISKWKDLSGMGWVVRGFLSSRLHDIQPAIYARSAIKFQDICRPWLRWGVGKQFPQE